MPLDQDALNSLRIKRDSRSDTRIEPQIATSGARWMPAITIPIVAIVLLLGGWWVMANNHAIEVEVTTASAPRNTGPAGVLDASGYVVARRQATVSSKVTGKVEEVLIEEGMQVKEGQILARLDASNVSKQLDYSDKQRDATRTQLAQIQVRLAEAEREARRSEQLRDAKLISEAAYDTAKSNVDDFKAQLEALHSQVAVANSNMRLQQQNVDDLLVRAPFSGVVISKDAQPGEMVSPLSASGGFTRTGIATIVDMDSREIEVDVNEAFINRVSEGQPAEATLNAYPDWTIPTHVISIVPSADRDKATVKVRLSFDKLDPRILLDMGVKVRFLEKSTTTTVAAPRSVIELPSSALFLVDEKPYVWRVADNRLEQVAVKVGMERSGRTEILSGISSGDLVVSQATEELKDGAKVKIRGG
jgi:RND family efflux transporter MFP subunit